MPNGTLEEQANAIHDLHQAMLRCSVLWPDEFGLAFLNAELEYVVGGDFKDPDYETV